jgi:hypothetical protein
LLAAGCQTRACSWEGAPSAQSGKARRPGRCCHCDVRLAGAKSRHSHSSARYRVHTAPPHTRPRPRPRLAARSRALAPWPFAGHEIAPRAPTQHVAGPHQPVGRTAPAPAYALTQPTASFRTASRMRTTRRRRRRALAAAARMASATADVCPRSGRGSWRRAPTTTTATR